MLFPSEYSRTLKKAQHRLLLWPGVEGDGSAESSTPAKVALGATEDGNSNSMPQDEMGRLEKVSSRTQSFVSIQSFELT